MDVPVEKVKELLTEIIDPAHQNELKIIPDHVTMLTGTKSKKQLSRKKQSYKCGKLSRRDKAEMGLYTLPTKQMLYEDVVPLHKLWCGYFREHIGLKEGDMVPEKHEKRYDEFARKLVKTDLHGAKIRVIDSKCQSFINISGIVVMETKNVLKVLANDNRIRTIPKIECIFGINYGSLNIIIFGNDLNMRPAERSTKKIKHDIQL